MRTRRPPKENDQVTVEKAFKLMQDLMRSHPDIEPSLWGGAMWSTLIVGYHVSGFNFDDFRIEVLEVLDHYKPLWGSMNE